MRTKSKELAAKGSGSRLIYVMSSLGMPAGEKIRTNYREPIGRGRRCRGDLAECRRVSDQAE